MFWSKIWLFLVALAGIAALAIALALPTSAHKSRVQDERQRLVVACDVVNILLEQKAMSDLDVVGNFSRDAGLVFALEKIKGTEELVATASPSKDVLETATSMMKQVKGADGASVGVTPTLAIVVDRKGRVVARAVVEEGQVGDVVAGRFLIDDALAGYLRDDVWVEQGSVFLMAASPIVSRSSNEIIGAAVLGWKLDNELADQFVRAFKDSGKDTEDRSIHVAFYASAGQVTKSTTAAMIDAEILAEYAKAKKPPELGTDCTAIAPFYARHDKDHYAVVMSRLPGEAQHSDAFYAVFTPRPAETSFGGAVGKAKSELGGDFPWIVVIGLFLLAFGVGVTLMIFETDRPLRRLQADAVRLAKGDGERLNEEGHHGRFGSIARSINIQVDKLGRDAKAAKKDLDQLLGPAPEGSLGAIDLLGTPLPSRPGIPLGAITPGLGLAATPSPSAPPPSEFRFGDQGASVANRPSAAPELDLPAPRSSSAAARPPAAAVGSPPRPPLPGQRSPTPAPPRPPAVQKRLDDDILSFDEGSGDRPQAGGGSARSAEEQAFHDVFEQFVELKRKCGEPTGGLTFAKFGDKLRKNRDDLMSKTGCTEVKFTVYVKDGKAALKATPVKES